MPKGVYAGEVLIFRRPERQTASAWKTYFARVITLHVVHTGSNAMGATATVVAFAVPYPVVTAATVTDEVSKGTGDASRRLVVERSVVPP